VHNLPVFIDLAPEELRSLSIDLTLTTLNPIETV
jgi:hypothetical protein